jgi:DNA-binding NarL/FixJ family response regulator
VRVGRESAGLARMQRALDWARTAGCVVEQHLAEVQLAEMLGLVSSNVSSRRWRELRARGSEAFRAVGGDPLPMAYAVSDAVAVGRSEGSEPKLSPREVEVLVQFAAGLSYREAAAELGIEWRTVQVHAKHIYAKLGVHGKIPAIRRAQELGII